ncbi:MAG: DUF6587 family protein [Betaproteobacteria bacterium]
MQTLITLLIVFGAAGYSVWKLAPAALRNKLAAQSGTLARATGAADALARRIEIKAVNAAANTGGCGNCGPCKGCATGQDKDETPAG